MSVLLHDIGRAKEDQGKIEDHAAWGAKESRKILAEFEVEFETIDDVVHCIKAHRYSNEVEPVTPEAAILSDADNLDALGAVGLARCFAHGTEIGSSIHDPELPIDEDTTEAGQTQLNHLYKKILDLPNRMYTDTGKRIAEERREFVEQFIDRFEAEAQGNL